MELSLKSSKIKVVDYSGAEHWLKKPTLGTALELEKKMKAAEAEGRVNETVIDFIVESGLPRDVVLGLEVDALDQIVSVLMPSKKKP